MHCLLNRRRQQFGRLPRLLRQATGCLVQLLPSLFHSGLIFRSRSANLTPNGWQSQRGSCRCASRHTQTLKVTQPARVCLSALDDEALFVTSSSFASS